jgi:RNA polymerase sigma-70 factor (ECF subfamily)
MAGTTAHEEEPRLLEAARRGDERAYRALVEPLRGELHAHCYRMLGSVDDAEDALQDALLRAWRGLPRFAGRSSLRTWLYRIATNAALDVGERRPKRQLSLDHPGPADPSAVPGQPLPESAWVEPYPDEQLGLLDGRAAPEARYERRESVELAFVAALQHLPARQRAVLILREVLGYSAEEAADALDATPASVNSALQRARRTVEERLPARSQQATLRALGDERVRDLVEEYSDAMERGDVERVVAMLAHDAAWSMPPLRTWYRGEAALRGFLSNGPLSGRFRWRHVVTRAGGQPAVGGYTWHEDEGTWVPFALDVLSLDDEGRIADVTAFIARTAGEDDRATFANWPDLPADPGKVATVFERFGLPNRLS